jgi:hypothetical protein
LGGRCAHGAWFAESSSFEADFWGDAPEGAVDFGPKNRNSFWVGFWGEGRWVLSLKVGFWGRLLGEMRHQARLILGSAHETENIVR